MYEFHPYITNDGSVGLYNADFKDIYHSATGALTEAYEKFIMPIDFNNIIENDEIKVLDICYGIGYNSKSFLNYLVKNFLFIKKNSKRNNHAEINIDPIYTNNIEPYKTEKDRIYNDTIHTYKNLPKIYIKAIDNDKILSFISPFIRTGIKNIKNDNLDFNYQAIKKYITNKNNTHKNKIDNIVNYFVLKTIIENKPEIFENEEFINILTNSKYKPYFASDILNLFKFYRHKLYQTLGKKNKQGFLHNIYYQHVSNCYKRGLKSSILQNVSFDIHNNDARKVIAEDKTSYDLIFLDAFTPSKCPCLWSFEFFKLLYSHLEPNGMLLTYSTSASIRNAMIEAGFFIGNLYNERENKFTGTIAVRNKSLIKYPLSEYDLGLLKTRAGIFYRDENLTGLNEAIIERRKFEVANSTKQSSSQYKKEKSKENLC